MCGRFLLFSSVVFISDDDDDELIEHVKTSKSFFYFSLSLPLSLVRLLLKVTTQKPAKKNSKTHDIL